MGWVVVLAVVALLYMTNWGGPSGPAPSDNKEMS